MNLSPYSTESETLEYVRATMPFLSKYTNETFLSIDGAILLGLNAENVDFIFEELSTRDKGLLLAKICSLNQQILSPPTQDTQSMLNNHGLQNNQPSTPAPSAFSSFQNHKPPMMPNIDTLRTCFCNDCSIHWEAALLWKIYKQTYSFHQGLPIEYCLRCSKTLCWVGITDKRSGQLLNSPKVAGIRKHEERLQSTSPFLPPADATTSPAIYSEYNHSFFSMNNNQSVVVPKHISAFRSSVQVANQPIIDNISRPSTPVYIPQTPQTRIDAEDLYDYKTRSSLNRRSVNMSPRTILHGKVVPPDILIEVWSIGGGINFLGEGWLYDLSRIRRNAVDFGIHEMPANISIPIYTSSGFLDSNTNGLTGSDDCFKPIAQSKNNQNASTATLALSAQYIEPVSAEHGGILRLHIREARGLKVDALDPGKAFLKLWARPPDQPNSLVFIHKCRNQPAGDESNPVFNERIRLQFPTQWPDAEATIGSIRDSTENISTSTMINLAEQAADFVGLSKMKQLIVYGARNVIPNPTSNDVCPSTTPGLTTLRSWAVKGSWFSFSPRFSRYDEWCLPTHEPSPIFGTQFTLRNSRDVDCLQSDHNFMVCLSKVAELVCQSWGFEIHGVSDYNADKIQGKPILNPDTQGGQTWSGHHSFRMRHLFLSLLIFGLRSELYRIRSIIVYLSNRNTLNLDENGMGCFCFFNGADAAINHWNELQEENAPSSNNQFLPKKFCTLRQLIDIFDSNK